MLRTTIQRTLLSLISIVYVVMNFNVLAAPNLHEVSNIDGVTIVADHLSADTFYYLKSNKRLSTRDGAPDFLYSVNRYIGRKVTGDDDAFWVRGVIKFSIESHFKDTDLEAVRDVLETNTGRAVELKAAPIRSSFNTLVYATIEPIVGQDFSGELDGSHNTQGVLDTKDEKGNQLFGSQKQRFTIGLSGNDANLFWENFERENLSLSLGYGWTIPGQIKDQNDEWIESIYQVNNSLPIDVSFSDYPNLFTKNELWQRVSFAHSGLKVMCYDFINLEDTDLYYVNVEVRFKTLRGQQYSREIKFRADTEVYEQDISFELANDVKDGYQYRVRRMTQEGDVTRTKWLSSETAWLDVSLSIAELTELENNQEEELEL